MFDLSLKKKWKFFYEVWPWAALLFLLLLLAPPSSAQFRIDLAPKTVDKPLEQLIAARAKLIKRYAGTYARGVSVCGEEDILSGEDRSWLTVYTYGDSLAAFGADFDKFAPDRKVDGVAVVVAVIERPKR